MIDKTRYLELVEYLINLEEDIIDDLKTKIKVVGDMLADKSQHSDLAIILNTETELSDSVASMAESFSKEIVLNMSDAQRVYSDNKYYFIRVGTEMGSDTGMKYPFDELNEVKEEIANY